MTRSKFRPEEDQMLRGLVDRFGVHSWSEIACAMPGRSLRQCRDRWKHYLSGKPNNPWTPEEDQILIQHVQEYGLSWTRISAFFANRTDVDVKGRWCQIFRKQPNLVRRLSPPRQPRREQMVASEEPRKESKSPPPKERVLLPSLTPDAGQQFIGSGRHPGFTRLGVEPLYDPSVVHRMRK
jgi:hypothetical protein